MAKETEMLAFMKRIIVKAGNETLKHFGKAKIQYTKKHEMDIVTQADLASNKIIIDAIKKRYPDHDIITEETKNKDITDNYTWIVDPLDGTSNFHMGIPLYAVIIALAKSKKVITGAIYVPFLKDTYYAMKGRGAFLNKTRIRCSSKPNMLRSRGVGHVIIEGKYRKQIRRLSESSEMNSYWVRETGTLAYDAMLVASGKVDWYFTPPHGGDIWDVAATYIIMKEAGCKVTNFKGKDWSLKDKTEVIAANPVLHKQIMAIIRG